MSICIKPLSDPDPAEGPAKRRGRRVTARVKLIDAAYTMMRERGIDGISIAELIQKAGVGVGSFYNHFTSKEDLAEAVFADRIDAFGATLSPIGEQLLHAPLATCYACRRFIEKAEEDKAWAAFVVQLDASTQLVDQMLRRYARVGMRIGIDAGSFKVLDPDAAITFIHSANVGILRQMLLGTITSAEAHRSILYILRGLGVDETEAQRLSGMSMDDLREEIEHVLSASRPAGYGDKTRLRAGL